MKKTYFKIIELPTHQVLVEKDWDAEKEEYLIVVTVWLDEVKVKKTFGYETLEKADAAFLKLDSFKLDEFLASILRMLADK